MHRLWKLLWMIFIFCVVFFIICDEKWYKIEWNDNHIVFNKIEKESDLSVDEIHLENVVYKNSDLVHLNFAFKEPKMLSKSDGMDSEYLVKLEQERKKIEEDRRRQIYTWPNIVHIDDKNSISNFFKSTDSEDISWSEIEVKMIPISSLKNFELKSQSVHLWKLSKKQDKFLIKRHSINLWKLVKIPDMGIETWYSIVKYIPSKHNLSLSQWIEIVKLVHIDKYVLSKHVTTLRLWAECPKVRIEKYELNTQHSFYLKDWVAIEHEFLVDDTQSTENGISGEMLERLLINDDIDVNTLESEDDEFLQKVFQETRDTSVMNLIVETYLKEYQFVKAKKFIEELPEIYLDSLKPSLNLRISFNSFALSSKTTNETLTALIQNYKSKIQISDEDSNWYLWILALMQRDYDRFFAIAANFTSDTHKVFTSKIQWYKDQISKQMWMPDYYFDTLVALELFNQWFFQPAKVLALYSLQQNSNYILPYQILAYANFLTNSRDTSIEYLKKLIDLDPNNAEKYQFLIGVAYYWNEKYEQSVIMLSMVKNERLRLDAERYLIRDYLILDQKNKLIASWNKLLWYDNLVDSDFYTYFYEVFYHPYSEWSQYQLYAIDTELADKMIRVCAIRLPKEEKAVCNYGSIGKNIALWKFEWLEQSLLNLATEYPQWYLYHALGEYYIKQWDLEMAKIYLLKAISLTQKWEERMQIKKLLQDAM